MAENEVLVDVEVTTANHVDTFVRAGALDVAVEFPFVVGRDLVGTVAGTGSNVEGFRRGQRVWCNSLGHGGRQGAAAERVAVASERLYPLPEGVDPGTAVTMLHPAATAYLGLFTHGRLEPDETVVVNGAAGNVGGAAVRMAAHAGARVVAVAHGDDAEHCRSLGAEEVVDYRAHDPAGEVRRHCPHGVNLWLDTAGSNELDTVVELLTWRGRVVLLAGLHTRPTLPAGPLYVKDRSVLGFAITNATVRELATAAEAINELLSRGALFPARRRDLPLRDTAEGHRLLESGELHGTRLVIHP